MSDTNDQLPSRHQQMERIIEHVLFCTDAVDTLSTEQRNFLATLGIDPVDLWCAMMHVALESSDDGKPATRVKLHRGRVVPATEG